MTDRLMSLRRLLNPGTPTTNASAMSAITANTKRGSRTDIDVVNAIDALKPSRVVILENECLAFGFERLTLEHKRKRPHKAGATNRHLLGGLTQLREHIFRKRAVGRAYAFNVDLLHHAVVD